MSVPTTLQGTHDGCGGKVTFRPATRRRQLLAGERVALSAACASCGEMLHAEWQLPSAVLDEARVAEFAEHALPAAAGAEDQEHAASAPAPRAARPAANLGDWRMRVRTDQPSATADASAAGSRAVDPAMRAYLDRFSSRVEHAREHLRQASDGLPAAFGQGGGGFRTPNFDRDAALAPTRLSSTPAALRPSAPAAPIEPAAVGTPAPAVAIESAVERAIASPTFHDDSAAQLDVPTPVAPMPEAFRPEPAAAPAPAPVVEPVLVEPDPVGAPALATLAPTDADVFPPAPAEPFGSTPAPTAPAPEHADVAPLSLAGSPTDAAAGVWSNLPVTPAMPAPVVEPVSPALDGPVPPAPSFFAALDDALEAGPPAGATLVEAAAAVGSHEPHVEAAGAAPAEAEPDASVAFEPDRGFDWGPADSPALPRRRRLGRHRTPAAAEAVAGPEVVFEPAPDPDLAPARPRVKLGFAQLAIVLALAVVCGIAAFKVVSTEPTGLEAVPPAEPTLVVPPAEGAEVPATGDAAGAGVVSPPEAPGAPVADQPAAGTTGGSSPSKAPKAQVPTANADTPVVTASEAPAPDSNPFARP